MRQIPSKIENQTQPPQNNTNYVRRVVESTVHKEDNSKEIKIINRNNNYTINVTNNNNTINVTNNNSNTNTNSNKEQYEKNKAQEKEVKIKTEPKKEPKKELKIQEKERERENLTKKESEKYYNRKEEEIIIKDNKEKVKTNNNYNIDNKKNKEIYTPVKIIKGKSIKKRPKKNINNYEELLYKMRTRNQKVDFVLITINKLKKTLDWVSQKI